MTNPESVARASARIGADVALDAFRGSLSIEEKSGKTDLVTEADQATQDAIVDRIRIDFPDATIVGEESGTATDLPPSGMAWLIDPIDGTRNFIREVPQWMVSVVCLVDREPMAAVNIAPALDDEYVGTPEGVTRNGRPVTVSDRTDPETFLTIPTLWWGTDRRDEYVTTVRLLLEQFGDIRRFGSAQFELSTVAAGGVEGVLSNVRGSPWDTVAGAAMVEWAGGCVTDIHGEPWTDHSHGIVASHGIHHADFCAVASAAEPK